MIKPKKIGSVNAPGAMRSSGASLFRLFAIIVIYHNRYLHVGNHRLELGGELTDKGGIVVDGKVGNDIDGEQTVWLGIEETMHLHNLFVGGEGLYDFRLQLGAAVLSRGNGIDANGHDDAVLVEHVGGNLARQGVDLVGRHRVVDVDVERADFHVGTVVVEYQVVHAMNALEG